jgi:DNA-binding transcriptional MerR regulator
VEYKIQELADLAEISSRTLRYYDKIGLLSPVRVDSNGYRVYREEEVDLLQQILLYREMDVPLAEVKKLLKAKGFRRIEALEKHLSALEERKILLEQLVENVRKTIATAKGEQTMKDQEKFIGFKKKMIEDNEKKYGKEARTQFGNKVVEESNAKLMGMTEEQFEKHKSLSEVLNNTLKEAIATGDPYSEIAQRTCELHKQWLGFFWPSYSKEAHLGLAQTYVDDPRFKSYYDSIAEGAAEFLLAAMKIYCKES